MSAWDTFADGRASLPEILTLPEHIRLPSEVHQNVKAALEKANALLAKTAVTPSVQESEPGQQPSAAPCAIAEPYDVTQSGPAKTGEELSSLVTDGDTVEMYGRNQDTVAETTNLAEDLITENTEPEELAITRPPTPTEEDSIFKSLKQSAVDTVALSKAQSGICMTNQSRDRSEFNMTSQGRAQSELTAETVDQTLGDSESHSEHPTTTHHRYDTLQSQDSSGQVVVLRERSAPGSKPPTTNALPTVTEIEADGTTQDISSSVMITATENCLWLTTHYSGEIFLFVSCVRAVQMIVHCPEHCPVLKITQFESFVNIIGRIKTRHRHKW